VRVCSGKFLLIALAMCLSACSKKSSHNEGDYKNAILEHIGDMSIGEKPSISVENCWVESGKTFCDACMVRIRKFSTWKCQVVEETEKSNASEWFKNDCSDNQKRKLVEVPEEFQVLRSYERFRIVENIADDRTLTVLKWLEDPAEYVFPTKDASFSDAKAKAEFNDQISICSN